MGRIIPFPNKEEYFLNKGSQALENNQKDLALANFEQAYLVAKKPHVALLYIQVLLLCDDPIRAKEIADIEFDNLSSEEEQRLVLAKVYLLNNDFHKVEQLMKDFPNNVENQTFQDLWLRIDMELNERIESTYSLETNETEKVEEDFKNFLNLSVPQQMGLIKDAKNNLSLNQLSQQAEWIFVVPGISGPVKVALIELLKYKGDHSTYNYRGFNKLLQIDLKTLEPFQTHPEVNKILEYININFEFSPSSQALLYEQAVYYLTYLYPNFQDFFTAESEFLDILEAKIESRQVNDLNLELKRILDTIDKNSS